jgi:tetratricopeptide (TPR) repeat protein
MTKTTTIPSRSLKVVPFHKDEWQFRYPRLDNRFFDLFDGAMEELDSGNLRKAESNFRLLLEGYPECIDAYHHLAIILSATNRHTEARRLWERAVSIGKSVFPKKFKQGTHRLPWMIIENRPFLRAYHSWGLQLLDEKNIPDALIVFNDMLSLNPNDNQGIRALAVGCYFELKQPKNVLKICKRYPNDMMEDVLYGKPLALFQLGRESDARKSLLKAIEYLPNVSKELLKKSHRPPKNGDPGFVTHGGADQAYYYWEHNGEYWKNTDGALDILRSVAIKR